MTETLTIVAPRVTDGSGDSDDLFHYFCCDENRAHCGADLTNVPMGRLEETDEQLCVVCEDLDEFTCPDCGAEPT